jgi:broad specificity phosphatase PhoE
MAIEITFETHSTSVDNERGIATGWLEGELSHVGHAQARQLGARRAGTVDVVFTSDLRRAVQTARVAFDGVDVPIHRDPRLRECNYGAMNGVLVQELERARRAHIDEPFDGGESYRQVVERVEAFLDDLAEGTDREAGRVLLIGHSATRWALDHLLGGTPLEELVGPFDWRPGWSYSLG